jgi:hypothetical protein
MTSPMGRPLVQLLGYLLLHLQDLEQHLGLSCHEGLRRRHGWWWQITTSRCSKAVGELRVGPTS